MSVATLRPRAVSEIDESAIDLLGDSLFSEVEVTHGMVACTSTCVSGATWSCDGSTFNRTCVSGRTYKCDG
ncbi:MAG: cinnamycin family lantibiotic [Mycobacterium sp.]